MSSKKYLADEFIRFVESLGYKVNVINMDEKEVKNED